MYLAKKSRGYLFDSIKVEANISFLKFFSPSFGLEYNETIWLASLLSPASD